MADLLASHHWPYPTLSRLHAPNEEPDRARVLQALKELRSNAASVKQTTYTPVGMGLIGLVVPGAAYLAETGEGWHDMEEPDPPNNGGTPHELLEEQRRYAEGMQQFRLFTDTDAALAQMLFHAADETWWEELELPLTGYGTRRAREFVDHMVNNYAKLDEETPLVIRALRTCHQQDPKRRRRFLPSRRPTQPASAMRHSLQHRPQQWSHAVCVPKMAHET
jgi:hypothetical protein